MASTCKNVKQYIQRHWRSVPMVIDQNTLSCALTCVDIIIALSRLLYMYGCWWYSNKHFVYCCIISIRPVWSESSMIAWRKIGSWATQWVHSEDSDQTGWLPRLTWVFEGHTCHFVGFFHAAAHILNTETLNEESLEMKNDSFHFKCLIPLKQVQ